MSGSEQSRFANCNGVARGEAIARLNDELRLTCRGGHIMVTRGVSTLDSFAAGDLIVSLRNYDRFDIDNDPHGERDFGDLTLCGQDLLWKIDYYDTTMKFESPDPADGRVTTRVMTVLLASEY